jgi:hypothetical protein
LLLAVTLSLWLAAMALTTVWVGDKVYGHLVRGGQTIGWQQVLLGAVLVKTIGLVPVIGGIVNILLYLLVLGAGLLTAWSFMRAEKNEMV